MITFYNDHQVAQEFWLVKTEMASSLHDGRCQTAISTGASRCQLLFSNGQMSRVTPKIVPNNVHVVKEKSYNDGEEGSARSETVR